MAISKGNSKIGNIPNISLIPVKDCGNCRMCARDCYALKAFRMYPGTKKSWTDNSKLARKNPGKYFADINAYLDSKNPVLFRWHVAGDILNQSYLDSMIDTAAAHPNTKFLAFTKMFSLDYSRIPENLSIVFSRWTGDTEPDIRMPQSWVQDGKETRIPQDAILCSGTCESCGMCFSLKAVGKDVYFHIH